MKKVTKSILALLTISAVITSCKKGEEDPAISFRGRDSRLIGEWKLSAGEEKIDVRDANSSSSPSESSTETLTITKTYDGSTMTEVTSWQEVETPGSTDTEGATYKENSTLALTIAKDGTATIVMTSAPVSVTRTSSPAHTIPSGSGFSNSGQSMSKLGYSFNSAAFDGTYNYASSSSTKEMKGRWTWADSKKSKVMVNIDNLGTFYVKQLKNKELVLVSTRDSKGTSTSTGNTGDNFNNYSATWTFKQ